MDVHRGCGKNKASASRPTTRSGKAAATNPMKPTVPLSRSTSSKSTNALSSGSVKRVTFEEELPGRFAGEAQLKEVEAIEAPIEFPGFNEYYVEDEDSSTYNISLRDLLFICITQKGTKMCNLKKAV